MKWTQVPDYEAMSRMAAQRMFEVISGKLAQRQKVRVGLATGNTMIRVYAILAGMLNKAGHELSDLSTYNLDEYVGSQGGNVAPSHPLSYRKYMTEHFYDLVDTRLGFKRENMFFPDSEDPAAYDAQIAEAGGLDFQLLGIGFCIPTIHLCKFCFQFTGTDTIFFGKVFFCINLFFFFHNFIQTGISHNNGIQYKIIVIFEMILLQERKSLSRSNHDFSVCWFNLSGKNF